MIFTNPIYLLPNQIELQQIKKQSYQQAADYIYGFCGKKRPLALRQQRQSGMAVLHYGVYKQNVKWNDTLCKERYEYKVRTRLRNYPYQHGKDDDPEHIIADPPLYVQIAYTYLTHQQGA